MILSTTPAIQGREVDRYLGIVFGDTVLGVNFLKDFLGSIRDFVGGRSATYERELGTARDSAMRELMEQAQALGADAVIGIDIDYEVLGAEGGMLMVSISGTAVALKGAAGGPAASPWTQPTG